MSKFTKGEWIFEESDFTIRTKDFQSNAGMGDYRGVIIASIDSENWRGVRPDSIAEKTANARLIAAAPNLLEACKRMRRRAQTSKPITQGDVDVLEAAIAKVS